MADQLINAAEGRAVAEVMRFVPDTQDVMAAPESSGCRSGIHPDRWRRGDDCIRESGVIQHLAGFLGNICKVAAVEADAVESQRDTGVAHLLEDADRVRNTGTQGM